MEHIRFAAANVDWATLLIGWLVALAPIMAVNAVNQIKHGKETPEAEGRYNRLALIWLVGFMPVLIMANTGFEPVIGLGWSAACLVIALAYLVYRTLNFRHQ